MSSSKDPTPPICKEAGDVVDSAPLPVPCVPPMCSPPYLNYGNVQFADRHKIQDFIRLASTSLILR